MRLLRKALTILAVFGLATFYAERAHAFLELNGFYFTDTGTTAVAGNANANSRMFIEGTLGFEIDKKGSYLCGWNYSTVSASDKSGATTKTYTATHMGPRFVIGLDKNNSWSIGLGYYLSSQATYSSGAGSSLQWKGTAMKFDFGYSGQMSESFLVGGRLNYLSATYNEQLIGSTTYSKVTNTRTFMYPSIYVMWLF